jgi:peptidoglycan/xylan/chitin deacetylase (PgdA/CDA1 family)
MVMVLTNLFARPHRLPEKIVVLTFDDAVASHASFVAPLLKKYGFGGTFFIAEFPPDFADKNKYMTWKQIKELNDMGFEIANHTQSHRHVNKIDKATLISELDSIEIHCNQNNIPKPISFAYPGYDTHPSAIETLTEKGYLFARTGGSRPYNPLTDHPLLIPSFSTTGTDTTRVFNAIRQAKQGQIIVFTIHGVPDLAHPKVTTPPEIFELYMKYLKDNHFTVIALRDLKKYIDVKEAFKITPVYPTKK